jgi:hypothetical protein
MDDSALWHSGQGRRNLMSGEQMCERWRELLPVTPLMPAPLIIPAIKVQSAYRDFTHLMCEAKTCGQHLRELHVQ